jgi:hypothetical protein
MQRMVQGLILIEGTGASHCHSLISPVFFIGRYKSLDHFFINYYISLLTGSVHLLDM